MSGAGAGAGQVSVGADASVGAVVDKIQELVANLQDVVGTLRVDKTITGEREAFPGAYLGKTTESGHEEAHQHNILASVTNHKGIMDDALFDLSYARKQVMRQADLLIHATADNVRNQQAQANATTLNGINVLQNIDFLEGAAVATILDRLALDLSALGKALNKQQ